MKTDTDTVQTTHTPLSVKGLNVAYGNKVVLKDIDFDATAGKLIAVIGPNGAGKSTFIKAALGLIPKLTGDISFFGQSIEKARKKVAYIPQRKTVDWDFPASALDVVAMGLYGKIGWLKPVTRKHRDEAMTYLEGVGLADHATHQIGQLSGGQQQRVFLARALAQNAELLLMDEPLAGVDAATEKAIIDILHALKKDNKTVICVHHDLQTVRDYFEHALVLNGKRIADGPVDKIMTAKILQEAYGGKLILAGDLGR